MDDTLATPFSLAELHKNLSSVDHRQLLRWLDCELYMAFVRSAEGYEEPAAAGGLPARYRTNVAPDRPRFSALV